MRKLSSNTILLLLIIALATFLRLYLLGSVPAGLTNDEANTGYDAYSLLLTGKDQWGHILPLSFIGFGDYPPPVYRYLAIPSIFLFGLNAFAVRLPSALFGIGSILLLYFLTKKLFSQRTGLFATLLFAVSPWGIGLSRVAIESNVAIFFLILGLYLFFLKKPLNFFLSIIAFVLTVYTYAAYTLFIPLLLFLLGVIAIKDNLYRIKILAIGMLIFGIGILPLFIQRSSAGTRLSQVGLMHNITSIGLIDTLNAERGACLRYLPSALCKLENNKQLLFTSTLAKNYLSHFSLSFLFISGTETQYSVLPMRGLDYLPSIILFITGIAVLIRKKSLQKIMLFLLLLAPVPDSLTSAGNYSRAFIMLPFLISIEAVGAETIFINVSKLKQTFSRSIGFFCIAAVFISSLLLFVSNYFTYFKDNYARMSQYGYQQIMTYIHNNKDTYSRIYITTHKNDAKQYIYYLFYNKYTPRLYQNNVKNSYHIEDDGWIWIDHIENISFVHAISSDMVHQSNVLLISTPDDFSGCDGDFSVTDTLGFKIFEAISSKKLQKCQEVLRQKQITSLDKLQ